MTELLFIHTASSTDGIWYSWEESSVVHLTLWHQMTHTLCCKVLGSISKWCGWLCPSLYTLFEGFFLFTFAFFLFLCKVSQEKKNKSYNLNWGFADYNKNLIHVPKS